MSDPAQPPVPGERRLERPPSDRYAPDTPAPPATVASGSAARGVAWGALAGVAGAVATVVLGGVLSLSAGLLVVAAATGWAIGQAVVLGGGSSLARGPRWQIAVTLAAVGVVLGQLGLWLYARTEGGVLTLPDYLIQTFGLLAPVQAILALAAAWWTAR